MAFITSGGNVISFCEYEDVLERDQRVFEANEGLTSTIVEDLAERATTRILYMIRNTSWWTSYYLRQSGSSVNVNIFTSGLISVPLPDANRIKARQQDFTDLCVFLTLYEYLLPKIADYSSQDNAEVKKIGVYNEKFRSLFQELIDSGDWYDFNNTGTVSADEKMPTRTNLQRVR
jgi:hypothetical protein